MTAHLEDVGEIQSRLTKSDQFGEEHETSSKGAALEQGGEDQVECVGENMTFDLTDTLGTHIHDCAE